MKERFGISKDSSVKAWLLRLSALWRAADASIHERECRKFIYSSLELVLADIILLSIAILHSLGVRNIENLIRRRLEDNDRDNRLRK